MKLAALSQYSITAFFSAVTVTKVNGLAKFELPDGQIQVAVWPDTYTYLGPYHDDSPLKINTRTGRLWPVFHAGQNIPVKSATSNPEVVNIDTTIDVTMITETKTNASMILDVYPYDSRPGMAFAAVTDADIKSLTNQLAAWNAKGVKVYLRLASEMNGSWYPWGTQPVEFKEFWIKVTNAVRAVAPDVAMVWSPQVNYAGAYGINAAVTGKPSAASLTALDTNNDGCSSCPGDDPYSPYYPGDQFVDWVGTSLYWHGPQPSNNAGGARSYGVNVLPTAGFFETQMDTGAFPFYDYVKNLGKPLQISEWGCPMYLYNTDGNGVYQTPIDAGPGEVAIKQAWWRQSLANPTILKKYPNIKMFGLFEFRKAEQLTFRDFQFLNSTAVSNALLSDMDAVQSSGSGISYVWAAKNPANSTADTRSTTVPNASSGSSVVTEASLSHVTRLEASVIAFICAILLTAAACL
ncbi:mannan endo-1,4-beta-mannosidase [Synchytrium endobioticum]|uniref:Mannan endo-1,4-beta-mannosidase n=1 Tax=Synchytrium endobioticum TaxID=286115 RepID=A0A507DJJ2_9FUNG|nr:mannan endo-1,4-beta-mannosidase [Synchytrium endobioticum]TPX51415.1 mannan endo-1,4-beta-mannosidase [Synchytrium endobioticum]